MASEQRRIPWDWYDGTIPDNVEVGEGAYIETSYCFHACRSHQRPAVVMGRGSQVYLAMMFDLSENARVYLGDYASITGGQLICDSEIVVGNYCLISWNVVIMDTYRLPRDLGSRRRVLEAAATFEQRALPRSTDTPRPVHIGDKVWIGFDSCILPGVRIGSGSIVAARSVVTDDVPAYTVVGGNPARVIRSLVDDPEQSP